MWPSEAQRWRQSAKLAPPEPSTSKRIALSEGPLHDAARSFEYAALQVLLAFFAGWVNRQQQDIIEYLMAENRVLLEQVGDRGVRRAATEDSLTFPVRVLDMPETEAFF